MKDYHPFPAIPLIVHDPFFSLWSFSPTPTSEEVRHWTGAEKLLEGNINIDGQSFRWLGRLGMKAMKLVETKVTPLSTQYVFEEKGVRFTVRFTSPLLTDDFDILSTPITYIEFDVKSIDGAEHTVNVFLMATESLVSDGGHVEPTLIDVCQDDTLVYGSMGQKRQKPLSGCGDHVTIDWGYLYFCDEKGCTIDNRPKSFDPRLRWFRQFKTPEKATLMVGYDDIASINYFGRLLPAYYARNGKTIMDALREFHARREEILARCRALDDKLTKEAYELGGQDYVNIVSISYRQSLAGHKLVQDYDGEVLFISKENDSNGCAATVDVAYAGIAMYMYYSPELVRAMLRPALKFAKMPVWIYDFSPHDVGRYPIVNGQVYAALGRTHNATEGCSFPRFYLYPGTEDCYDLRMQFPVEECGNMILMLAGAAYADGDYSMCEKELPLLQKWCNYLLQYGEDPGEQLCTDDFTGHLAHNANLAAKAIMGIKAFGVILDHTGHADEAAQYHEKAKALAENWLKKVWNGSCTTMTLDGIGWSIKYNLVWDKLFGWGLLPDEFYEKELRGYLTHMNAYGLPLDARADYTKPEWSMYIAAMAVDMPDVFGKMVAPMAKFLAETEDHVPFCDLYDTVTGLHERFYARTVVGGTFMPLVMKKWQNKRK